MAEVVLGIETSCDETSAAVLVGEPGRPELASLVILSQDVHKVFGGVVPELASRAHLAALPAVVDRALAEAGVGWGAVEAVAVTQGPGLVGALLVGVVYAKALAYARDRDLIGVHHMEGHLFAPAVEDSELAPPPRDGVRKHAIQSANRQQQRDCRKAAHQHRLKSRLGNRDD